MAFKLTNAPFPLKDDNGKTGEGSWREKARKTGLISDTRTRGEQIAEKIKKRESRENKIREKTKLPKRDRGAARGGGPKMKARS